MTGCGGAHGRAGPPVLSGGQPGGLLAGGRCGCFRRSPPFSTRQTRATRSASRPARRRRCPSPAVPPRWARWWSRSAATAWQARCPAWRPRGGARYGIIPGGNGNDLARVLGIPTEPGGGRWRVLTAGQERRVDLIGVATPGRPETVVACSVYLGDPLGGGRDRQPDQMAARARSCTRSRPCARWPAGRPPSFRVEISRSDGPGGRRAGAGFAGYAVVVANAAYFGAGMKVAPARCDDGMLDIVTMRHGPRLAFIRALLKIRNGSHTGLAQISLDRGTEVTVTVDRRPARRGRRRDPALRGAAAPGHAAAHPRRCPSAHSAAGLAGPSRV